MDLFLNCSLEQVQQIKAIVETNEKIGKKNVKLAFADIGTVLVRGTKKGQLQIRAKQSSVETSREE